MAITISAKISKQAKRDTIIAFIRSNGNCVFCEMLRNKIVPFNNQFEREHLMADKDDSKMLLACSACNQAKSTQTILQFCYGQENVVTSIIDKLSILVTENQIALTGKAISQLTCENSAETKMPLSTSEMKWLIDVDTRIDKLPIGTVIHASHDWINKLNKCYDLTDCQVYIK